MAKWLKIKSFCYNLFIIGKAIFCQIGSGDDFESLRKTIGINILDFNYLKALRVHKAEIKAAEEKGIQKSYVLSSTQKSGTTIES